MRQSLSFTAATLAGLIAGSRACDSCFGPINKVEHVRHVKRMQPDANNATYGPTRGALEWGQINFLHTVCIFFPNSLTSSVARLIDLEFVDGHPRLVGGAS